MNLLNGDRQDAGSCGPGCNCGTGGGSARVKWVVCGFVALAAVVTVAAHLSRTRSAKSQGKQEYATAIPVITATETAQTTTEADGWGAPLTALSELNLVATNTDGVFIVLPSGDATRTAAIQKEVAAAATTISGRGSRMGTFLLSRDAQEYGTIVAQVGAPAVLAMCKGRGMAAVRDREVTQEGLLRAFVASSRPSGCGPSGCGPGSSGCN